MRSLSRFLAIATLCLITSLSRAVIMVPLAVEDLTQRAELILHGTVVSKVCQKDSEGRIYTRLEFRVREVWKGILATNTFAIVHGGGLVGEERTLVDGEATYEVGEELVAFVRLNQRGEGVSIGLAQGQFKVWKDEATGEQFAHNIFHGKPKETESVERNNLRTAAGNPVRLGLVALRARVTGGAR